MTTDPQYMTLALELAARGKFTVSPNPMVGCVIVNNHDIVGQGYHRFAGDAHAEVYALNEAKDKAKGATAYVTLEPCCHFNRTPPCTDALIAAGIKKVVIATLDPNPKVSGNGMRALQNAGIEVELGLFQQEATQLNTIFFHYMKFKRPYVFAKWAMSLDGKTCVHPSDSLDISTPESQQFSHQTRQLVDAILIGAKTAIHDNPKLTVRTALFEKIKHPMRIVLSSCGDLPLHLNVFNDHAAPTIVATTDRIPDKMQQAFCEKKVDVLIVKENAKGQVDLHSLMNELGKREITSLLVEGGMQVQSDFLTEKLVNKIHVYLAPLIIAELNKKQLLQNINLATIDRDYFLSADYGDSYV